MYSSLYLQSFSYIVPIVYSLHHKNIFHIQYSPLYATYCVLVPSILQYSLLYIQQKLKKLYFILSY